MTGFHVVMNADGSGHVPAAIWIARGRPRDERAPDVRTDPLRLVASRELTSSGPGVAYYVAGRFLYEHAPSTS